MRLFNTATRQIEDFEPAKEKATMYSCGPTVYDHVHIGNLRAYVFADTLRRALNAAGWQVEAVMNLTDVDDKTIIRSQQFYPDDAPSDALSKLTKQYEELFLADTASLGIDLAATKIVRATEHIDDMTELINKLGEKGLAYESDGSVYFDIAAYVEAGNPYGVLSRVDFTPKARISSDEYDKDNARDFALWKAPRPGEPSWSIDFNGQKLAGRPGWHIECSAMSTRYLGQPFDIHTGGVDLIFPHHEDEIAQSRGAEDRELARFFVHNEHLLVNGAKMSKSLNNFYTLSDITDRGYDPLAFRLLVLMARYDSQLNFTWDSLTAAQTSLYNLKALAARRLQPETTHGKGVGEQMEKLADAIKRHLLNNLDTPSALADLFDLADKLDSLPMGSDDIKRFGGALKSIDSMLGLGLSDDEDITDEQKEDIKRRDQLREAKDYAASDTSRAQLEKQGIGLNDTPFGTRWFRLAPTPGD